MAEVVTGGGPESVNIPEFNWVNTIIGNVKNALRGTFHAISERHFHRFLPSFVIGSTGALIFGS